MLIGVDFDNTIVRYDTLFHRIAVERGMIPQDVTTAKESVRNYLRRCGREDDWTELQGYVYGVAIEQAPPFDGVLEFFEDCRRCEVNTCIISHRTRFPFRGPDYDLHAAARQWLQQQGFHDKTSIGLPPNRVFLEETKQGKLDRIQRTGCSHFIDDLPEFLCVSEFPRGVQRILFDPHERHTQTDVFRRTTAWSEISELLLGQRRDVSR